MENIELTKRQRSAIDRWLKSNIGDERHSVAYAVDATRRIAYPELPDAPLCDWERYRALADHIRRRCVALGVTPRRLGRGGDGDAMDNPRCSVCGREFVSMHGGTKRCPRCRQKGLKLPKPPKTFDPKVCDRCGRTFQPKAPNSLYCGEECRKAEYAERSRARYEKWKARQGAKTGANE